MRKNDGTEGKTTDDLSILWLGQAGRGELTTDARFAEAGATLFTTARASGRSRRGHTTPTFACYNTH